MLILVDADSFYCAVQRVFNPRLRDRPLVVLSNNDGAVVSRTREAKALGIKMGQPFHELQNRFPGGEVVAVSSNYALYHDMSMRMQRTIEELAPKVEHYSIDESYVETTDDAVALGRAIRQRVRDNTGLPVSIGIGPTKVLTKVAMEHAKTAPEKLFAFPAQTEDGDDLLAALKVDDVWGIAAGLAARLRPHGVQTALDLKRMNTDAARRLLGVPGERIVMELRGVPCLPIEDARPARQSILRSRSFGHPVMALDDLIEAVSTHASRAAEKLREDSLIAGRVSVSIGTNPFRETAPQYFNSCATTLDTPCSFTPAILEAALMCLRQIYRPGFAYKRAGVLLSEFSPADQVQLHFNSPPATERRRRARLMAAVDGVNLRFGRETLRYASAGFTRSWQTRSARMSPSYTTKWSDIPVLQV